MQELLRGSRAAVTMLLLAAAAGAQMPGKPGVLEISSTPPGATIYINGQRQKPPTNANIVVSQGHYTVEIKNGQTTVCTKDVTVKPGDRVQIQC
jgi:PEGA domain